MTIFSRPCTYSDATEIGLLYMPKDYIQKFTVAVGEIL